MLQKNPKVLIYGNLTNDRNIIKGKSYFTPGGSSFFSAKILSNFDSEVTIVSSYGPDFSKKYLPGVSFIPEIPNVEKTILFRNHYRKNGVRSQEVENFPNASLPRGEDIPLKVLNESDLLIIAPIINNIPLKDLEFILNNSPKSLKVLIPQGFFRQVDDNNIVPAVCGLPTGIISMFDIVVVSEKDFLDIDRLAEKWSKNKTMTIVTRAGNPATVYYQGKKEEYPAFRSVTNVDETGAGDIFAASFSYAFLKSKSIRDSIYFAHASALLSLSLLSYQLKYGLEDIIKIAQKEGRSIII